MNKPGQSTTALESGAPARKSVRAGSKFELLKAWYLANLRQASVKSQVQLTPAALINADKEQIEQLILSGVHHGARGGKFKGAAERASIEGSLRLSGAAALIALLASSFLVLSGQLSAPAVIVLISAAMALVGSILTYRAFKKKIFAPLQVTGNEIADCVGHDLFSVAEMVPAISAVIRERDEHASGESLIVDSAPILLWCANVELRLAAVNIGSTALLGYATEELTGADLKKFILSDDRDRLSSALDSARNGKTISQFDCRLLSKFGKALDFQWTIDWSESAQSYFLSAEDVSDAKRLERARKEFTSTMGHDIKIPLTSTWMALQSLLLEYPPDLVSRQKELVTLAESNVERLVGMLEELLEYENTQSGQLPISYDAVSTAELIEEAIDSMSVQSDAKKIRITSHLVDVVLEADESKLLRVVTNFLSNATKFSPHGSDITVTASVTGDFFEVKVRDQGPGIPGEYKELIFERYERLPSSQHVEGSGLGLSICKAIIESHAGFIGVNTPETGGSEFWFAVPVRAPQKMSRG